MSSVVDSFLENLKTKFSNPFLGTIIFVTLLRYWEVFYAMLTFDADCDMLAKQTYIHNYFAVKNFWEELVWIIIDSFIVLVITYCLIALSGLIVKFFNKQVISRTDKITDKNSVKTLSEYLSLEGKYDEAIKNLKLVNKENNELEVRIGDYKAQLSSRETKLSEVKHELKEEQAKLTEIEKNSKIALQELQSLKITSSAFSLEKEVLIEDLHKLESKIETLNRFLTIDRKEIIPLEFKLRTPELVTSIYEILRDKNCLKAFRKIATDFRNSPARSIIAPSKDISMWHDLDLITVDLDNADRMYKLTFTGEAVANFAQKYGDLKNEFIKNNFTEDQIKEFENLPYTTYNTELKSLATFFITPTIVPPDFKFPYGFQEFMLGQFYLSYNKGFLEFTNRGLRMIHYLQNIIY